MDNDEAFFEGHEELIKNGKNKKPDALFANNDIGMRVWSSMAAFKPWATKVPEEGRDM